MKDVHLAFILGLLIGQAGTVAIVFIWRLLNQ